MSSGIDSSGRIPPVQPPRRQTSLTPSSQSTSTTPPASTTTPQKTVATGFLDASEADSNHPHPNPPSSSRSADSISPLASLRDSPSSSSSQQRMVESPLSASPIRSGTGGARTLGGNGDGSSPGPRRRPSPLELGRGRAVGLDEELEVQREEEGEMTATILADRDGDVALSKDMQDLSVHHQSARQGTAAPGSSRGTRGYHSASAFQSKSPSESETITIQNLLELLRGSPQLLILDTRPLGSFLEHHLPRSANISIPSLIYKRFRKSTGAKVTSLDALTGFISTSAGRHIWDGLDLTRHMDVVVIGLTSSDELATVLGGIMQGLVQIGGVRVLSGGWDAVLASPAATSELVCGETSDKGPVASDSLPPPNPGYGSSVPLVSPTFSTLRPTPPGSKRNLPSLSVQGNNASSRRPPKLSLNLDKPLRSATLGSFPAEPPKQSLRKNASMLSINTGESSRAAPGLSISVPKTPMPGSSFQALCHAQSKLPPSPSSFGDVKRIHDKDEGIRGARTPITPWLDTGTARPNGGSNSHSPFVGSGLLTGGQATVRNPLTSFVVSTILPSFLYLGPEISTQEDVDELRRLGVKRILNVAIECDDDEGLGLKDAFEKYCRVPMRDIVEESGVAKGMRDSCDFLDDARLHSAPTYVHCKAGRSRSVTVVLAYLIHANAWTLKTSYAYVAERRKGISPNIGFVAELMQFEETELGLKQSGGVHGEGSGRKGGAGAGEETETQGPKGNPRHMRDSLPPTWGASLDSRPPKVAPIGAPGSKEGVDDEKVDNKGRPQLGDEREVRKNGQWVHHRRAPVDRTTLQPGRRVSKAGLESLRSLNPTSPRPSPQSGEGGDKRTSTPSGEGRLSWV